MPKASSTPEITRAWLSESRPGTWPAVVSSRMSQSSSSSTDRITFFSFSEIIDCVPSAAGHLRGDARPVGGARRLALRALDHPTRRHQIHACHGDVDAHGGLDDAQPQRLARGWVRRLCLCEDADHFAADAFVL